MAEFKVLSEIKNPLFNRIEIELFTESKTTPIRKEIEKFLSEKYSSPIEGVYVDTIKGKFGSKEFKITSRVYTSKEDRNLTELKTQKQKKAEEEAAAKPAEEAVTPAEAPKPAEVKEAPTPAKVEETPKEEKKEEVKEEKK